MVELFHIHVVHAIAKVAYCDSCRSFSTCGGSTFGGMVVEGEGGREVLKHKHKNFKIFIFTQDIDTRKFSFSGLHSN